MGRSLACWFFETFCNSQDLSTDLTQDRLYVFELALMRICAHMNAPQPVADLIVGSFCGDGSQH